MQLSTQAIRDKFISFFQKQGHRICPSSSLIPVGDDSLFFTNAGMVQFKKLFLGQEQADFKRASTIQRCLRASGKHNDLANVGFTKRHHTFFEMLGNFSFGDYFKKDAIHFAWQFLTQELGIPANRLWVTVHEKDQEAAELWQNEFQTSGCIGQGISTCGDSDNFWSMGNIGPCGYCSEIYYDHGDTLMGDPPGCGVEGERYVEIWNLVFMQFERKASGEMVDIPACSIDTGMGLERIAAVMQQVDDNYDIDLFKKLRQDFRTMILQISPNLKTNTEDFYFAERVVSDHIRAVCFLIADQVLPSNEGPGYVLRSIIRRAVYYIYRLGIKEACFYRLTESVVAMFKDIYPEIELLKQKGKIIELIAEEEERFLTTLERGMRILNNELVGRTELSAETAFKLHDTFGVPFILTQEIAKQKGVQVHEEVFNAMMERQRKLSRLKMHHNNLANFRLADLAATQFVGDQTLIQKTTVEGLLTLDGEPLQVLNNGENGIVILHETPFYGESGGQIGDSGKLVNDQMEFVVSDTKKMNGVYLHFGTLVQGTLKTKEIVSAQVDELKRLKIQANHSATHLLHRALRDLLGEQATQRGSYVDETRLRFDFSHNQLLTKEVLEQLERMVNAQIRKNHQKTISYSTLEEAKKRRVTALFNEKYGQTVRIVTFGEYSSELCGGTHVNSTGEIGYFKILKEESIAAGVRRIEAMTGESAVENTLIERRILEEVYDTLKSNQLEQLPQLVSNLLRSEQQKAGEITALKEQLLNLEIKQILSKQRNCLLLKTNLTNLKRVWDLVKEKNFQGIALLYLTEKAKFRVLVGVSDAYKAAGYKANEILKTLLTPNLGHGGGKNDLAEGGGVEVDLFLRNLKTLQQKLDSELNLQKNG